MRRPERLHDFYRELTRVHVTHFPDLRFGQFCIAFMHWITTTKERDPFFIEEPTMIDLLHEYVEERHGELLY